MEPESKLKVELEEEGGHATKSPVPLMRNKLLHDHRTRTGLRNGTCCIGAQTEK